MPKVRPATVAAFALSTLLLGAGPGPGTHPPPGGAHAEVTALVTAGPNLSTIIDPAAWWMESGANVTLTAAWTGVPAGCGLRPMWYRWAIAPGGSEGTSHA